MERKVAEGPRLRPQLPCLLPTRRTVLGCGAALAALPSTVPGARDGIWPISLKPPCPVPGLEGEERPVPPLLRAQSPEALWTLWAACALVPSSGGSELSCPCQMGLRWRVLALG